jgi:hypothetical protein
MYGARTTVWLVLRFIIMLMIMIMIMIIIRPYTSLYYYEYY